MIQIKIPKFQAVRYMVHDWGGPLRGFETKAEAEDFVNGDSSYWIQYIPPRVATIDVEEAPF
jgi:hypothetical protein